MPPRYAYWTILIDEQPTAFRASLQEDLMPTFKRLKEKNPSAKMMWWQNGKLWASRLDAQEAMHARGEMGRRGDARQGGGFRDRNKPREQRPERDDAGKLDWKPKGGSSSPQALKPSSPRRDRPAEKLEWRPKGEALAPRDHLVRRTFRDNTKRSSPHALKPSRPPRSEKLEWRPKGSAASSRPHDLKTSRPHSSPPKRKWVPKEEYKRTQAPGSKPQAPRDKNWRPGGEHKDPRQKYKDAKKAKWTRFKQTIRKRWEAKQPGVKKRRDEE